MSDLGSPRKRGESERPEPKPGEWAVIVTGWSGYVLAARLERVTAKTVTYTDHSWGGPRSTRIDRHNLKFSGPEAIAKRLAEQLKSSDAMRNEERRNSNLRHDKRAADFIAQAYAVTANAVSGPQ